MLLKMNYNDGTFPPPKVIAAFAVLAVASMCNVTTCLCTSVSRLIREQDLQIPLFLRKKLGNYETHKLHFN